MIIWGKLIPQEIPQPSNTKNSLEITYKKFHLDILGANELTHWVLVTPCGIEELDHKPLPKPVVKSYASFFIDFFKGCNTFSQHEWTNFHNIANKSLSNMQIYKFTSSYPPQQAMLSRMNDVKKDVEEHT